MHQIEVSKLFSRSFELKTFNKVHREEIMGYVFSYVLGLNTYSYTFNQLKEFELSKTFSQTLRSLPFEDIKYIMFQFRKGVKRRRKSLVVKKDRWWIDLLGSKVKHSKIQELQRIPNQDKVLMCVMPNILNTSSSLIFKLRWDRSLDRSDIVSELSWKAVQAYRIYVFSYGHKNFNAKVLLSCVYKGIRTKSIDYISSLHKKKRLVVKYSYSMDELLENNGDSWFFASKDNSNH